MIKFKIQNSGKEYFVSLVAANNGQILMHSESYKAKASAVKAIDRIVKDIQSGKFVVEGEVNVGIKTKITKTKTGTKSKKPKGNKAK